MSETNGEAAAVLRHSRQQPTEKGKEGEGALMKRALMVFGFVVVLVGVPVGGASAHVHGVTPLLKCSVVPATAGANQTDGTPASAANGGPITGLIPRDVGKAPLDIGDGGFDAPVRCP
ncbi:MAG: hypothetical protein ACRDJL_05465 [Actinomycetota bacterium]